MPITYYVSFEHKTTAVNEMNNRGKHKHTDAEISKIFLVSSVVEQTEKGKGSRETGKRRPLDWKSGKAPQKR